MSAQASPRLVALIHKELRQMLRDRSNLAVGLLLPIVLILLFGYGLSFDVTNVKVALVMEDPSPTARDVLAGLHGSAALEPIPAGDMHQAERMMLTGQVDAIVRVPGDFTRRLADGQGQVQVVLNGVDSSTASTVEGYISGALSSWSEKDADRLGNKATTGASVAVVQRTWFNEAGNSTWYLVPGLIVLVLTLIGAFLTSLLVAREWERGTLEALFVTPVRPLELVISKLVPYLGVGAVDLVFCLVAAKFLFKVPIHGSLPVIVVASVLYLLVSLSLGLLISAATKSQFQASQLALLTSFMPAMMLSGFVFDLRNVPWVIQAISQLLPATHFMSLIKTLFLAGDNWHAILRDCSILAAYAALLIYVTSRKLRKTLD